MKTITMASVLALLLAACGEPDARPKAGIDTLDDVVAGIEPGQTSGQIEELLAPFVDTSVISSRAGTGSGYTSRRAVRDGRLVLLAFSYAPGSNGPSDRDVLVRRPSIEVRKAGEETR